MQLDDRQLVEGTEPRIYIGHRVFRDRRTGEMRAAGPWYAEYNITGQKRYAPLKTRRRDAAIRAAFKLLELISKGEDQQAPQRTTIQELRYGYLQMLRQRGRAHKTLEKYTFVLTTFCEWADGAKLRLASAFEEGQFWTFKQHMADQGLSAKTQYDRLIIVKQMFKWAVRTKLLTTYTLDGAQLPKPSATQQPCFTPQQVHTLLKQASDHLRPIFAFMAYAGLRFGEVRDLQWSHLMLDQGPTGFIVVQRGGSGDTTKSRRMRRIPLNRRLREIIDKLPRRSDCLFHAQPSAKHPEGDGPLDERRLIVALKRLCRRCGLTNPNQYKLHTFRHAFASMGAREGISYRYMLEWMGHTSSQILDMYFTMFDDAAEQAMQRIDYASVASGGALKGQKPSRMKVNSPPVRRRTG